MVAGTAGGLLGIGGGALVVPGLVFLAGLSQHRAHGTSLATVLAMSIAAVSMYSFHGHIDWLLSVEIAAGGIAGAVVGARLVGAIRNRTLRLAFCAFLILIGCRMILAGLEQGANGAAVTACAVCLNNPLLWGAAAVLIGVVAGVLSAILGIGGGAVMVPAMVLLLCVPQKTAQGVSLAAIVPTALTGTVAHRAMGNVDLRAAAWVGFGGFAGALLGATIVSGLTPGTLKLAFGVFLVVMSVLLALKRDNNST